MLDAREGSGDGFSGGERATAGATTGLLLGFLCAAAVHGDTAGGTGWGFSMAVPSFWACRRRFFSFCDILIGAALTVRSLSLRERPIDKFDGVAEDS